MNKDRVKYVRKNFMVSQRHQTAIKEEQRHTGYSESEIVRRAIDGYLFKKRRKVDFSDK